MTLHPLTTKMGCICIKIRVSLQNNGRRFGARYFYVKNGMNPSDGTGVGYALRQNEKPIGGIFVLYYSFFIIQYSSLIKTDFRNE